MTDPFAELHEPIAPTDPDPVFARRLRARVERALALPRGVVPVTATFHHPIERTAYRHGDVMHVAHIVPDVGRARAFYADVLGWSYLPDGRVDGSAPSVGFRETSGTPRLIGDYAVADLEVARQTVDDAGGTPGPIERYEWGTVAECVDDQGVEFRLHQIEDAAGDPPSEHGNGPGDLEYLTLLVGDTDRAREFYGAVLGWTFRSAHPDDRWHVDGPAPAIGMAGGHAHATGMAMWQVRDIDAAVAAVREHGGTATEPDRQPYGITADCTDDQGLRFHLGQS